MGGAECRDQSSAPFSSREKYFLLTFPLIELQGERQRRLVAVSEALEGADPAPSPARAAEDRQMLAVVLKAIQRLPEQQREALVLSVDEDMRYDQIGAILGCSVAAVKVRIHRARLQLKSELEEQERAWKT